VALGFVLMAIKPGCGIGLAGLHEVLVDNVIGKKQIQLLTPSCLAFSGNSHSGAYVLHADSVAVQVPQKNDRGHAAGGAGSHRTASRLAFYDANKTGALVSRIDASGRRS